jgi:hypothetical protein
MFHKEATFSGTLSNGPFLQQILKGPVNLVTDAYVLLPLGRIAFKLEGRPSSQRRVF